MKYLGLLVLAVGVGVAAAFGARLTDAITEQTRIEGAASLRGAKVEATKKAYCDAREESGLGPGPVCEPPERAGERDGEEAEDEEAEPEAPPTYDEQVAAMRAALQAERDRALDLPEAVGKMRGAWLDAREAAIEPTARATTVEPQGPGARLSSWFGTAGVPFSVGIALVVLGAIVGRVGVRREAEAEAGDGKQTGEGPYRQGSQPTDFGELLASLQSDAETLANEMAETDAPDEARRHEVQGRIEAMQLEKLEGLIEARGKLQLQYGLAGFAAVFGPLSGGERKINRAWSALVDQHWPEATASMQQAATLLDEASDELGKLSGAAG